ncbi:MAG TPA: hypothetical protein VKP30_14605 [Polyangiaceae bacterium]|nr:hypothetical protein [Polyangiaceae bacterium]
MTLEVSDVSGKHLRSFNANLELGLHVLLALDATGLEELVPLLDGSARPRRGTVRLDGVSPYHSSETRRHIGSLWVNEYLPLAPTVERSLYRLELSRAVVETVRTTLDELGHPGILNHSVAQLDRDAMRTIALAIAFSKPDLKVLLLTEPFALGSARHAAAVAMERVMHLARKIPVLIVTSSQTVALRLGGAYAELGGGFCRRIQASRTEIMTIRIAGQSMRPLAAELVRRPRVCSLRITAQPEGYDELWLQTTDPSSLSLDLVRAAQQLGVRIWSIDTRAGA